MISLQKRFHAELSGNERGVASLLFSSSLFSPLSLFFSFPSFFLFPLFLPLLQFFRTILAFTRPPSSLPSNTRLNCRRFSMGAAVDRGEIRPGETCLYSRPRGGRKERKNRESLSRLPPRWLPRCRCSFPSTILLSFPLSLSLYTSGMLFLTNSSAPLLLRPCLIFPYRYFAHSGIF